MFTRDRRRAVAKVAMNDLEIALHVSLVEEAAPHVEVHADRLRNCVRQFVSIVERSDQIADTNEDVEPELGNASQYGDLVRGSGGLYRLGFGRPSLCGSLDELSQHGSDRTEEAFNRSVLCSPMSAAGGYPNNQGFGNLGRNVLRGFWQRRVDLSLAKAFSFGGTRNLELRWDVFNVFNTVNFANPNNDLQDAVDFGVITNTIGGPRVGQFRAKFTF